MRRSPKASRNLQAAQQDEVLRQRLAALSQNDPDYWTFRHGAKREHAHSYFQYPAMMVPGMQRELINTIVSVVPAIRTLYDPFVGSGTTMTEGMMLGLDFMGQDINPLAVLLCRAKSGPFYEKAFRDKTDALLRAVREDCAVGLETEFPGRDKWFRADVAIELSRIRRAIQKEPSLWARRLFWVALAETVRLTSNSRTSTFKLHIRPLAEIERMQPPITLFEQIARRNLESLAIQKRVMSERGLVVRGRYRGSVAVHVADSAKANNLHNEQCHDLLVSSPPYGDNKSTVPYGQHSYLPLQWIDLSDIDAQLDNSCLATTLEIDSRSLGGLLSQALKDATELKDLSPTFKQTLEALKDEPADRAKRVAAYCRDLNNCLGPVVSSLRPNGYMVWTVGNRQVAKRPVPVDGILVELLSARGVRLVTEIQRLIPSKRMAVKNCIADTMRTETVLILRKEDVSGKAAAAR